ncbi:MAG TPA: cyclic peptide export ABC transporter [Candidatus Binatia bacterium]
MKLLPFVPARSWLVAGAAVVAGLIGGGLSAWLIALVNRALNNPGQSQKLFVIGFIGLVVGKVATNAVARILLNDFAQRTIADLCRSLSRKVLAAPLGELERVGIPRILVTLTDDIAMIGWAAQNVPSFAMNVAVLAGCAIYLSWLSWKVLVGVTFFIVIGAFLYRILTARAYKYLQHARDTRDVLFQHFRALTEGIKELKLHAPRREAFLSERINTATEALRRDALAGVRHHTVADTCSQLLFYGAIGGTLLATSVIPNLTGETRTGYVLAMLYVMNPVWSLMEGWPIFARARIALEKVNALGLSLEGIHSASAKIDEGPVRDWNRLDLEGITFAYPADSEGRAFMLGPLNFSLRRGELVFVTGGNGSGKSTLVKVVTGLYSPHSGTIRLDGRPVGENDREAYCRYFSAVFSDFYLFDSLLGLSGPDLDGRASRHLVELELDAKVRVTDGNLSTTALSQGQRKRLALLTAFMEDREIYVFDEWAADQDPHYREIFYKRLLPQLKSRGKTVVVISHDDRYYHLADRVVKLDYGSVVVQNGHDGIDDRESSVPERSRMEKEEA